MKIRVVCPEEENISEFHFRIVGKPYREFSLNNTHWFYVGAINQVTNEMIVLKMKRIYRLIQQIVKAKKGILRRSKYGNGNPEFYDMEILKNGDDWAVQLLSVDTISTTDKHLIGNEALAKLILRLEELTPAPTDDQMKKMYNVL